MPDRAGVPVQREAVAVDRDADRQAPDHPGAAAAVPRRHPWRYQVPVHHSARAEPPADWRAPRRGCWQSAWLAQYLAASGALRLLQAEAHREAAAARDVPSGLPVPVASGHPAEAEPGADPPDPERVDAARHWQAPHCRAADAELHPLPEAAAEQRRQEALAAPAAWVHPVLPHGGPAVQRAFELRALSAAPQERRALAAVAQPFQPALPREASAQARRVQRHAAQALLRAWQALVSRVRAWEVLSLMRAVAAARLLPEVPAASEVRGRVPAEQPWVRAAAVGAPPFSAVAPEPEHGAQPSVLDAVPPWVLDAAQLSVQHAAPQRADAALPVAGLQVWGLQVWGLPDVAVLQDVPAPRGVDHLACLPERPCAALPAGVCASAALPPAGRLRAPAPARQAPVDQTAQRHSTGQARRRMRIEPSD